MVQEVLTSKVVWKQSLKKVEDWSGPICEDVKEKRSEETLRREAIEFINSCALVTEQRIAWVMGFETECRAKLCEALWVIEEAHTLFSVSCEVGSVGRTEEQHHPTWTVPESLSPWH